MTDDEDYAKGGVDIHGLHDRLIRGEYKFFKHVLIRVKVVLWG